MDNILAKHLANTLLFPKHEVEESVDENNISFSSYKIIDEKYYIKIPNEVIVSKVRGYWNNKPVIIHNEQRYALLENSKSLVNLDVISGSRLHNNVKEKQIQEPVTLIEQPEPVNTTLNYVTKSTVNADTADDSFFRSLEKYKDDPRVKKLFSYHTDLAKKELFQITEKFTQQQMARAMESGGGTNAVQYANGGVMTGNLLIDGNLSVTGKMNEGLASNDVTAKKIFYIGNGVATEYTVAHNLDTKDILISLYDIEDRQVFASVKNVSVNETTISFSQSIANNSVKVVIVG